MGGLLARSLLPAGFSVLKQEPPGGRLRAGSPPHVGNWSFHTDSSVEGLNRESQWPQADAWGYPVAAQTSRSERDASLFQIGLRDPRVLSSGRRLWRRRIEFHHHQTCRLAAIHHREDRWNVDLALS